LTAVFLGSAIAYVLWRWSEFLVWDDTSSAGFNVYSNNGHFALDRMTVIFGEAFSYIQADGYRPISAIIRGVGAAYVLQHGPRPEIFIFANGIVCGLTAALFLKFAHLFLLHAGTRYFATFLLMASTPVLTGSLVLFSGIQFLVFAFILSTLNVYFAYDRSANCRWLFALAPLLVAGPLVREFVGIVGPLIIVHEILHRRGIRLAGIIAGIAFLHALFPTFLISFVVPDLPVTFVFNIGNVNGFLSRPGDLHWRILLDVFSVLPPSLLLLALGTLMYRFGSFWTMSVNQWRGQLFLLIFFAASFFPFLKLFNSQVHLAYSLIPLSVLVAAQIEQLLIVLVAPRRMMLRACILAVVAVAVTDHAMNIYSVRQVTRDIYGTIISIARWFQREVPKGTVVISNAHHLEDIRLYSRGHIDPWASVGGIPDKSRWLHGPEDYRRFLDERRNGKPVFLLDVRLPELSEQRGRERVFREVRDPIFAIKMIGKIASVASRYPFVDPLRVFLPTKVAAWPGPPDLEFDFYRGPSLDGLLFTQEVAADYVLYRVTGDRLWQWAPHPVLLRQSYFTFNIVGFRDRVYAIPEAEGSFDVARFRSGGYSRSFEGTDMESVMAAIGEGVGFQIKER